MLHPDVVGFAACTRSPNGYRRLCISLLEHSISSPPLLLRTTKPSKSAGKRTRVRRNLLSFANMMGRHSRDLPHLSAGDSGSNPSCQSRRIGLASRFAPLRLANCRSQMRPWGRAGRALCTWCHYADPPRARVGRHLLLWDMQCAAYGTRNVQSVSAVGVCPSPGGAAPWRFLKTHWAEILCHATCECYVGDGCGTHHHNCGHCFFLGRSLGCAREAIRHTRLPLYSVMSCGYFGTGLPRWHSAVPISPTAEHWSPAATSGVGRSLRSSSPSDEMPLLARGRMDQ